jgi:hypothetical protein
MWDIFSFRKGALTFTHIFGWTPRVELQFLALQWHPSSLVSGHGFSRATKGFV